MSPCRRVKVRHPKRDYRPAGCLFYASSVALHKKFGFTDVGVYQHTGYKMGKWWDLLVMEKRLHSLDETPQKPKTIHEISYDKVNNEI